MSTQPSFEHLAALRAEVEAAFVLLAGRLVLPGVGRIDMKQHDRREAPRPLLLRHSIRRSIAIPFQIQATQSTMSSRGINWVCEEFC